MTTHFRIGALLILLTTCGCSTVISGRTQDITINSEPAGAACVVENNGDVIATLDQTPGTVTVEKSKNDVLVKCTKQGYGSGRAKNHSDYALTNIGNMALWQLSFVGNMVDSASGAANKYDSTVFVKLYEEPHFMQQAEAPAALPAQQPIAEAAPAAGGASSPRAQALAAELAAEVNAQQTAGGAVVLSPHTQELASALAQEVTGSPAATVIQASNP